MLTPVLGQVASHRGKKLNLDPHLVSYTSMKLKTDHTPKPKRKNSKATVRKQNTEEKTFGVGKDILKYKKNEP